MPIMLAIISCCAAHPLPRLTDAQLMSLSITRSQAVAWIADRTASQHLWGSRDVIGHVTIWCHFLLVVLRNQASISNGFRDIQRRV